MKIIKKIISKYIEDILIFLGLLIIIFTTLKLNFYAGMYILGIILTTLGFLLC